MLELELDAGGQERRALEKPGDHRIRRVADEAAEALRDAWIVLSEFGRLLTQDLRAPDCRTQEFPVHRSEPVDLDLAGIELDLGDELDRNVRPARI